MLLRARFDKNKNEVDMRVAKKLLLEGEKELFLKQHPQPVKCKYCTWLKYGLSVSTQEFLKLYVSVIVLTLEALF